MEFLKELFDGQALTFEELEKSAVQKGMKLADLSEGRYVDLEKFKRAEGKNRELREELLRARERLDQQQGAEEMREQMQRQAQEHAGQLADLERRMAVQQLESQVELALVQARAKNLKAARALLDLDELAARAEETEQDWRTRICSGVQAAALENPYLFGAQMPAPPPPAKGLGDAAPGEADRWRLEAGLANTEH